MKKYFVSLVVIISFIAYSFYQRAFGQQASPILTPKRVTGIDVSSPSATNTPTPSATPTPSSTTPAQPSTQLQPTAVPNTPTPVPASGLKDGTFTGNPENAFYGIIQVQATISQGKITNIQFLQYPNDRSTSIMINQQADPLLAQEAIQKQNAQVDVISGATDSSLAFIQSLQSALDKAKI